MSLLYAKFQLTEWGRWSRDPPGLRSNWRTWFTGGSRAHSIEMPKHIAMIDRIVCRMDKEMRIVTIVHYCRTGKGTEKAQSLGMPKYTYYRRVEQAQWFVSVELENEPCEPVTNLLQRRYRDLAVTKAR